MNEIFALTNDTLQAIIAIFGAGIVLYNLESLGKDRILRAFSITLSVVVLVYFTELLVSRTQLIGSARAWLLLKWVGIAFMPAAQFHLSDALLVATGSTRPIRRALTTIGYSISSIFYLIVLFTPWIVGDVIQLQNASHFQANALFPVFALYYWGMTIASLFNVWQAYKRCIISVTRRRILYILGAIVAAPLSVFPYIGFIRQSTGDQLPTYLWILLIIGNLFVGILFTLLTTNIAYLGSVSSDRPLRLLLPVLHAQPCGQRRWRTGTGDQLRGCLRVSGGTHRDP